jgi:hypothetical protein
MPDLPRTRLRLVRGGVLAAAVLALCGCWNGKDQYRKLVGEGHARQVPIIIYDITANNPADMYPVSLAFAFLNTQETQIDSVTISLAACDAMGQTPDPIPIVLSGPFEPHASFVINPVGPDERGHQYHVFIPHAVVIAITVTDSSGTHEFTGKQVDALLDSKVANYCIARAM